MEKNFPISRLKKMEASLVGCLLEEMILAVVEARLKEVGRLIL